MQQIQNALHPLGQPLFARVPQCFLAITQEHQRLALAPAAQMQLAHHPGKDHLGPRARHIIARQAGPDFLVLRLRTSRRFRALVEQGCHHFLGRAPVAVHRVHRADRRHAFPARLVAFGTMRLGSGRVVRAPHHDPFLIRAQHQDFPFFLGRRLIEHKGRGQFRHLLVHVFQTIDRLGQAQNPRDRRSRLSERLLHAQRLVPVLQEV